MKKTKLMALVLTIAVLLSTISMASVIGSADAQWQTMFDWENETDGGSATSTTITAGDLTKCSARLISSANLSFSNVENDENSLIEGSKKVIILYNQTNKSCNPTSGNTPGSVALDTAALSNATDLRVCIGYKNKTTYTTTLYIGLKTADDTYYINLKSAIDNQMFAWYNFVGKTATRLSNKSTKVLTASDIQSATNFVVWNQTSGYVSVALDDIQYSVEPSSSATSVEVSSSSSTSTSTSTTTTTTSTSTTTSTTKQSSGKIETISDYKNSMNLVFDEDFNEDTLDPAIWDSQSNTTHRNNQVSVYKPENATIKDGILSLNVKREPTTCGCEGTMTEEEHIAKYGRGFTWDYSAAGYSTRPDTRATEGGYTFRYGLVETRVKTPIGAGTWCSVWLCGVNPLTGKPSWPETGEIDMIEYRGVDASGNNISNMSLSNLHYNNSAGAKDSVSFKKYLAGSDTFNDEFHTVGMFWTDTYMAFYVDNEIVGTKDITSNDFRAFKSNDFYFMLTCPFGGSFVSGDLSSTPLPQSMDVDYVKVWQSYDAEAETVTDNSVTLKARDGYEYSIDKTNWQSSPTFTNLLPGTNYNFYQRLAKTDKYGYTDTSDPVTIKTAGTATPDLPIYTMDPGSRPGAAFSQKTAGEYVDLGDEYGYVLKLKKIQDQISYFSLPSDIYTANGTPTKLSFDIRSDTGNFVINNSANYSFYLTNKPSDTATTSNSVKIEKSRYSFTSRWLTISIDLTSDDYKAIVEKNYRYICIINRYSSSNTANYLYIDNVSLSRVVESDELSVDVNTLSQASIRLNSINGIRFYTEIDKDKISELKAKGAEIEMGTLIAPKDLIDSNGLTFDSEKYLNVEYLANEYYTEDSFEGIVGSIAKIKETTESNPTSGNIAREFVGRGYVKVTLNGKTKINYATVDSNFSRSLAYVANALKNDTDKYENLSSDSKILVNKWASFFK